MIDKNVAAVVFKLVSRSNVGLAKYGVTTERKDIDLVGWLTHLQEEVMDAAIYLERIKQEINDVQTEGNTWKSPKVFANMVSQL
jgi:hypothetical protein